MTDSLSCTAVFYKQLSNYWLSLCSVCEELSTTSAAFFVHVHVSGWRHCFQLLFKSCELL